MSRSKPTLGDILICQTVSSHKGTVYPEELDSGLVMVYLGTVANDTDPDAADRMRRLGWSRTIVYEVQLGFGVSDEDAWLHRWNYEAETPKEAALAAIRYARVVFGAALTADPENKLLSLAVRAVELGPIDDNGKPLHSEGPALVEWKYQACSFDALKERVEEL